MNSTIHTKGTMCLDLPLRVYMTWQSLVEMSSAPFVHWVQSVQYLYRMYTKVYIRYIECIICTRTCTICTKQLYKLYTQCTNCTFHIQSVHLIFWVELLFFFLFKDGFLVKFKLKLKQNKEKIARKITYLPHQRYILNLSVQIVYVVHQQCHRQCTKVTKCTLTI